MNAIFESVVRWMNERGSNCKTDWPCDIARESRGTFSPFLWFHSHQQWSIRRQSCCLLPRQIYVKSARMAFDIPFWKARCFLIIDFVFNMNFIYDFHYCAPFDGLLLITIATREQNICKVSIFLQFQRVEASGKAWFTFAGWSIGIWWWLILFKNFAKLRKSLAWLLMFLRWNRRKPS